MIDCPRSDNRGFYRFPNQTQPMNIRTELKNIHAIFGVSETANRRIQKLFDQYAQEYHETKLHEMAEREQKAERMLHIYNLGKTNIPEGPKGPIIVFYKSKL